MPREAPITTKVGILMFSLASSHTFQPAVEIEAIETSGIM
jgi:hypothetical protein